MNSIAQYGSPVQPPARREPALDLRYDEARDRVYVGVPRTAFVNGAAAIAVAGGAVVVGVAIGNFLGNVLSSLFGRR